MDVPNSSSNNARRVLPTPWRGGQMADCNAPPGHAIKPNRFSDAASGRRTGGRPCAFRQRRSTSIPSDAEAKMPNSVSLKETTAAPPTNKQPTEVTDVVNTREVQPTTTTTTTTNSNHETASSLLPTESPVPDATSTSAQAVGGVSSQTPGPAGAADPQSPTVTDLSATTTATPTQATMTNLANAAPPPPHPETPEESFDPPTRGPAVADRRVQTTEVPDGSAAAAAAPTNGASDGDAPETASSGPASSAGPASQSPQSPRNPKYVDIDSVKHPEEPPPPEMPSRPFPQNITVRLENLACEHPQHERPGLRIDIEKTFKQLAENVTDVQLADASCKMFLTLNLTVTATDGDFKKLLAKLEEHVKNITVGEHMIITGFTLHDGAEHQIDLRPTVTRAGRFPTYREELIILIAVIVLLCIVLFIACVICSIRCCRRSPSSKTLDLLEAAQTPRSHSRSVDFNNRIPRAHTLYSPTASEYSGCLSPMTPFGPGVVQPFDTCLVPLEDVTPSSAPRPISAHGPVGVHPASRTAPATRPNNLPLRPRVDFSPDKSRFRSYNYPPKHSRTLPSTVASKNFSKSSATQSTEQLTKNHSLDEDSGVDNPTYLPTPSTPHVAETHKM
ncbi:hypothetical protein BIW11_11191 [Tropilaelaps mercedesae]|uniref:Uncharacterized protein n=1 Tax=Tropilaelaps mercedesae TaxID=418985 RepID=A0A1V9XCH7_9ACAR|nr:hypothetical protein BIW11_11191 [Tropilaelaps mercedesae]